MSAGARAIGAVPLLLEEAVLDPVGTLCVGVCA